MIQCINVAKYLYLHFHTLKSRSYLCELVLRLKGDEGKRENMHIQMGRWQDEREEGQR